MTQQATITVKELKDWGKQWAITSTDGDYYKIWKDTANVETDKTYTAEWEEEVFQGKTSRRIKKLTPTGGAAVAKPAPTQQEAPAGGKTAQGVTTNEDIYVQTMHKVYGPAFVSCDTGFEALGTILECLDAVFRDHYKATRR